MSEVRLSPKRDGDTDSLSQEQVLEKERAALGEGPYAALCLSGGGMRSASFCLGFLRGFWPLLSNIHYLSTVSGGGYAGSWLSNLVRRDGWQGAMDVLQAPAPTEPMRHLRRYSDLFEAKSWVSVNAFRIGTSYLRSLVVWWMLYLPLALLLAALPWVAADIEFVLKSPDVPWVSTWGWLIVVAALAVCGSVGAVLAGAAVEGGGFGVNESKWRELLFGLLTVYFAGIAQTIRVPILTDWPYGLGTLLVDTAAAVLFMVFASPSMGLYKQDRAGAAIFGGATLALSWWGVHLLLAPIRDEALFPIEMPLCALGAWLASSVMIGNLGAALTDRDRERLSELIGAALALSFAISIVGGLVVYSGELVQGLKWLVSAIPGIDDRDVDSERLAGGTAAALLLTAYVSYRSRISKRRPHGAQRHAARVITFVAVLLGVVAWVLAGRVWAALVAHIDLRRSNALPLDRDEALLLLWVAVSLAVMGLWCGFWSQRIKLNTFSLNGIYRLRLVRAFLFSPRTPTEIAKGVQEEHDPKLTELRANRVIHLINAAVNDVGEDRLEWRERRAAPFVFSPLYCGSDATQYRPTEIYAQGKITLGRAMAISGAAANPNMGYFATKPVTWLLGIFNLRLGWWLGNPKYEAWKADEPPNVIRPLLQELRGVPSVDAALLNISDGGHFENLGLYEAIRRKCRCIVAVDASHDPDRKCEDLARAERLIRIDFGTELRWFPFDGAAHYRVATILYDDESAGTLVYVKPELTGNEPADVLAYARHSLERGARFPHEATSDLWFGEAQFESYLRLGQHSAEMLMEDMRRKGPKGAPLHVAAVSSLTTLPDDWAPQSSSGGPIYGLPPVAPPPPSGLPEPWWAPLLGPVAASVAATVLVAGGMYGILASRADRETQREDARTFDGSSTTVVTTRRATTVITGSERTILLPWFGEGRPTAAEWNRLVGKVGPATTEDVLLSAADTIDGVKQPPVLYSWALAQLGAIRDELRLSCDVPIQVRGLSSSSQFQGEAATSAECGDGECKNIELANRRAGLIAALLGPETLPRRPTITRRFEARDWTLAEKDRMVAFRFVDVAANRASVPPSLSGATQGYLPDWGMWNRGVELVPISAPCDTDAIQARTKAIVVDRMF